MMNKNINKNMNKIFNYIFVVLVITLVIISLYLFIKKQDSNMLINNDLNMAGILIRQSARYSHAARQDKDLLIALLHANYGTGYLYAAKDIFPETTLVKLFNSYKEFKKFERGIIKIQDEVNTRTITECPSIVSIKDIVTKMGGTGDM